MKYVIIDEFKVPQHSLDKCYTLDEVKDYPNVAILIEEPFVILDMDDMNHAEKAIAIINHYNIQCNIMKTDRGCHFWFKAREPMVNHIKSGTPITAVVDVKSWGKKSLVTVKKNGIWREWLLRCSDVEEIPFWLTPIKTKKDLMDFTDGDGRDDGLFTYIIPLLKHKFTKDQIEVLFNLINNFIFKTPLLQREIDKMFKDNDVFDETLCFYDKKEFLHHEFAFWLRHNYPIEFYDGQLYLYNNGVYIPGVDQIEHIMIKKIPKLKNAQRIEVLRYLELICKAETVQIKPLQINLLNGIYDIELDMLIAHSPKIFTINQIPVMYNKDIVHEDVDNFLNDISDNDDNIRALLEELIGYCLVNDCRFQKAFILLGAGANGKSVFLKMLTKFLGRDNVSSVPLEELNGKFETAELVGKLANIGDDISSEFLHDSSMFKKLVTGDSIKAQRKYQALFQFNNISKLIFSANNLPPVSDKSYGLHRRLCIIPFQRTFDIKTAGYDPNILNKITDEIAMMYVLNLAIEAIKRTISNEGFTVSSKVDDILEEYVKDNNTCIQWLEDEPEIDEVNIITVYKKYSLYCMANGVKPYKKSRFISELLRILPDIRVKNTTQNKEFIQVFSFKGKTVYKKDYLT